MLASSTNMLFSPCRPSMGPASAAPWKVRATLMSWRLRSEGTVDSTSDRLDQAADPIGGKRNKKQSLYLAMRP